MSVFPGISRQPHGNRGALPIPWGIWLGYLLWLCLPVTAGAALGWSVWPVLVPTPPTWVDAPPEKPPVSENGLIRLDDQDVSPSSPKPSPASTTSSSLPSWVTDPVNSGREAVFISRYYATVDEAESELLPQVSERVVREFHRSHPWQGAWHVAPDVIRQRLVQRQFVERIPKQIGRFEQELVRVYWQVGLQREALQHCEASWKQQILLPKFAALATLAGWLGFSWLLGATYFWLIPGSSRIGRWLGKLVGLALSVGSAAALACAWRMWWI